MCIFERETITILRYLLVSFTICNNVLLEGLCDLEMSNEGFNVEQLYIIRCAI